MKKGWSSLKRFTSDQIFSENYFFSLSNVQVAVETLNNVWQKINNIKLSQQFVDYIISENIWKVCSIFNGQNFTRESDESEITPNGDIGNSLVKSMWVNFLHQANCETKYTIPENCKCWGKFIIQVFF